MSINKNYVVAGAMMASVALPLMNVTEVDAATDIRTVTASSLNFRTGPSTSYKVISLLYKGQQVEYISKSGDWLKVKYNGKTGYVHGDYVSTSSSSSSQAQTRTITASANFRTGPSTNYSIIRTFRNGDKVEYLGMNGDWAKVKYAGKTGYVFGKYVSGVNVSEDSTSQTSTKYVKATSGLNVRSGRGTSYSRIGKLDYKEKVTVYSTSNGWSKIKYGTGYGYVDSSYLQSTKPSSSSSSSSGSSSSNSSSSSKINSVVSLAKSLLGRPYVWGAQGPSSFDCSGFTYYIFKTKAGIALPRTSSAQSQYGQYVKKSNLRTGDLVFFDTIGSNNGAVSHVGLYVGNGKVIHASSGQKRVVTSDLNSSYYRNAYVNARRVL